MTVDDIGRQHVSCVRIGVSEEVGEADGGEGVVIIEGAFIKLYHDLNEDLLTSPWMRILVVDVFEHDVQ